jgi:hypothetical protein
MLVVTGVFENERFIPDKPVSIPQNTKVTVTFEETSKPAQTDISWSNPLLGLAKAMGSTLTLDRFMEMQQEEIVRENENDQRLWGTK